MPGCVVQVWFVEGGSFVAPARFQIIDTNFQDFEAFCRAVSEDQFISGDALWSTHVKGEGWMITRRLPVAFRGSAVLRCQLPSGRYFEEEDA